MPHIGWLIILAMLSVSPAVLAYEGALHLVAVAEISLVDDGQGGAFSHPSAVSVGPFGNVFIADTGNHRILQFDPDGRFVVEKGGYGWDVGELSGPTDVCAREGFRVFVVDEGNERIQEFDISDSAPRGSAFPFREGEGIAEELLVRPYRFDLDEEGRVYVSDALSHCVWIFSPTGERIGRLGELGAEAGQMRNPAGIAVGPGGQVYVADAGNHRVQIFDAIGNWVGMHYGPADDPLETPIGADVDAEGNLWIADASAGRVRVFTPDGNPLLNLDVAATPVDVALTRDGRVWIVDEERESVARYRIERLAESGQ